MLETLIDIDFNCGHPMELHCVNAYGYSFLLVIASDICIKLNISQLSQAAGHAHILFSHKYDDGVLSVFCWRCEQGFTC